MDNNEMRDEPFDDNEIVMNELSDADQENLSEETEECVQETGSFLEGGQEDNSESQGDVYADLNKPYVVDRRKEERDDADRRRHERTGFTYPLELKIFSPQLAAVSFSGYIEDISISGAGIKFEDKYGRIRVNGLSGTSAKLRVRMPHGDDIALLSTIMWIRRDKNEAMLVKIGIEFQRLEDWQLKTVKQLISLKNKDQNMMWNLFENYENNIK